MRIEITICALTTLLVALIACAPDSTMRSGHWSRRASMQAERSWIGMESVGGKIYVIGGMTGSEGRRLNDTEVYDPQKNAWKYLAPMPTARSAPATAEINGIIYIIGGLALQGTTNIVEAYDIANDRWLTDFPPLPTKRFDATAVAFGNLIYVLGGYDNRDMNIVEVLDTAAKKWSPVPPLPTSRYALQAIVIDDLIYALGGRSNNLPSDVVEVFNPKTQTWHFKTRMPEGMAGFGTVMAEGLLRVVKFDQHFAYDPRANTWQSNLPPMPTSRQGLQLAYIDGVMYAVGGCAPGGINLFDVARNEAFSVKPSAAAASDLFGASIVLMIGVVLVALLARAFGQRVWERA